MSNTLLLKPPGTGHGTKILTAADARGLPHAWRFRLTVAPVGAVYVITRSFFDTRLGFMFDLKLLHHPTQTWYECNRYSYDSKPNTECAIFRVLWRTRIFITQVYMSLHFCMQRNHRKLTLLTDKSMVAHNPTRVKSQTS